MATKESDIESAFKPFRLGKIVISRGAMATVPKHRMRDGLRRHESGDWGAVSPGDAAENDLATREGSRLFSAHPIDPTEPTTGYDENCFWIITEANRSATTILLPEEY